MGAIQESVLRGRPHNRSRPQHWSCSLLVGYQHQLSELERIVRPDHPAKPRHPFINISGLLQKDDVQARVERSFLYNPDWRKQNNREYSRKSRQSVEEDKVKQYIRCLQSLWYTIHQDP